MKKNIIIKIVLLIYTLIIMLPPLIHGYIYPNRGDDAAFHLNYFDRLRSGAEGSVSNYIGQDIVGYPILWLNDVTGLSTEVLFLWFNYLVLWLVGIAAFVLIAKFIDWKVGLLSIPLVMFMSPSTLNLFHTGAIFDLVTVGVLLPSVIYCCLRLLPGRKWHWAIPIVILGGLVLFLHTMGIWRGGFEWGGLGEQSIPTMKEFIEVVIGVSMFAFAALSITIFLAKYKHFKMSRNDKVLLIGLSSIVLLMGVLVFTGIIGWSLRIALDLAIVFPLAIACVLGVAIRRVKNEVIWAALFAIVIAGSIPQLTNYYNYNSAVLPIDKEVIEYVNTLPGDYYSCSPEVSHWIYSRFLNKKYKDGELPYIARSQPMTPRSTPGSLGYWGDLNVITNYPLDDAKQFKEGWLEIYVVNP
ncbi:hypothetical protein LCGC14_1326480 [marine sediment metagenome]|uniref:Glycosyltransferase RgtA/B/C/D-like domain-containing protein n=1 Tax=marine sediment metagenome TaxID=412755 RepID=A0A0F9KIL3_9ZZZZ